MLVTGIDSPDSDLGILMSGEDSGIVENDAFDGAGVGIRAESVDVCVGG